MIGEKQRRFVPRDSRQFAPRVQAVLVQLAEARDYACDVQCDPWQYAVEIGSLLAAGATTSDLPGLIGGGYVAHGREVTKPGDAGRRFRKAGEAGFSERSCFVATDAGLQLTIAEPAEADAVRGLAAMRPTIRELSFDPPRTAAKIEFNPGAIGDSSSLREAFSKLAHAEACAHDSGCSIWEYAIEIERLLANGLWASDLRWLVNKGYVAHAVEVTRSQDTTRRFQPCDNLSFSQRTCFVFTEAGSLLAANAGLQSPEFRPGDSPGEFPRLAHSDKGSSGVPGWDYGLRILHVDGRIVKQYRVPSPGQEAILRRLPRRRLAPCSRRSAGPFARSRPQGAAASHDQGPERQSERAAHPFSRRRHRPRRLMGVYRSRPAPEHGPGSRLVACGLAQFARSAACDQAHDPPRIELYAANAATLARSKRWHRATASRQDCPASRSSRMPLRPDSTNGRRPGIPTAGQPASRISAKASGPRSSSDK